MGSFTALFLPGGLRRRCLLCTSAQIGDVPPASPVATRSLVFFRTIRIYGFCVGLEIQIYIYILFRYKYYLTYIFVCLRLYWSPFLSVSKSTTTHLLSSAGPTGFLVPLSFRFGGWRGGLGRSRSGCPTWLRCIRPWCPSKRKSSVQKWALRSLMPVYPLARGSRWLTPRNRGTEAAPNLSLLTFVVFFNLFSCIVNMLLGFVSIPSISHSEFLTDLKPTCHPTKGVDAGQFSRALTGTSDWSWLAEVAVPPRLRGFFVADWKFDPPALPQLPHRPKDWDAIEAQTRPWAHEEMWRGGGHWKLSIEI